MEIASPTRVTFFEAHRSVPEGSPPKLVVAIHLDGSVEYGPGIDPEEGARTFYNHVCEYIKANGLSGDVPSKAEDTK